MPTASTTAALALGDALAVSLLDRRGFDTTDFAALILARLGKKLMRVEAMMHSGDNMPRVAPSTKMPDIMYEMSQKGLGMTTVVDDTGHLVGIVTDGDLRRLMQSRGGDAIALTAEEAMTRTPTTVGPRELASIRAQQNGAAKNYFGGVVDENQKVCGVLTLHDLWTLELY